MRIIFLLSIFIAPSIYAQFVCNNNLYQTKKIAELEKLSHSRLLNTENLTGASNNIDIKYYRIEIEVDPAVRYINGKVTIYFIAINNTANIILDLMNPLIVDSVKQRLINLSNSQSNNTLQIHFNNTINANTLDSITIFYKGIPPNTGFGSFIQDQHAGIPVMWSLSEPYGSRDWWPCKNGLDDKADSIDVFITTPPQFKAASNGLLQSEIINSLATKKTTHWKHRYPIASYLICFAVTNYVTFNNSVLLGNVTLPMQTFCYPENLLAFQNGTQNVLDALQLYQNAFGEYPFIKEKYGHVQFGWGGGMEHQTSTFIVSTNEGLITHELGHQWFGDKVTCGSWEDIWLNEGFATFLSSYYMENKYPTNTIANRKTEIDYITSQIGGSVKVDDTTNVGRIFDPRLSYSKGSHLLYMLRWKLGDSAFFKALKNYQQDATLAYNFAKTSELKKHFEATSNQNLTSFFNEWFIGQGYPTYNINWSQIGSNHVKFNINQTTSHSSVSFFELPIALKFKNNTQEKTIIVDNKINGEIFIKNIGFIADTLIIDPDYWLISKNNIATKNIDVNTSKNFIQVFPNPMQNQFYINLKNFSSTNVTIHLFNSLGQLVYTKNNNLINGGEFIEIPTTYLPNGYYYLKLNDNNSFKYIKKILK